MDLDQRILDHFTKEELIKEFFRFKEEKRDKLSDYEKYYFAWGSDGVTLKAFESDIQRNAEEICRRVYARRYFFHPLREVVKKDEETGKERTLSISTLRDILVQRILYKILHEEVEKLFTRGRLNYSSFAYRKGKSAPMAARFAHHYLKQGYIYIIDADIQKFFDKIPHDHLRAMINSYFGEDSLTSLLLWRFIRTDRVQSADYNSKRDFFNQKPKRTTRIEGIPQGGVLSGLIANLYLHPFDKWILEDIGKNNSLKYIRYADDFIVMLREETVLKDIRDIIATKLDDCFGLKLHTDPNKTKLITATKDPLIFVGFEIAINSIKASESNIKRFKKRFLDKLQSEKRTWPGEIPPYRRLELVITRKLNFKIEGRSAEICQNCGLTINPSRNWMGFFMSITDMSQINNIDKWIRQTICQYFYKNYSIRLKRRDLIDTKLLRLKDMYIQFRKHKDKRCMCEERVDFDIIDAL